MRPTVTPVPTSAPLEGQPVSSQSSLGRRWRRFVTLSPADRLLFLKLWLLLGGVSLLLRVLDFQRARRLLVPFLPAAKSLAAIPEDAMSYALRVGHLARIAGRHVPTNGSCLRQSLLVWWLLRRRGLPAELRIGISQSGGFAAHAWVELEGQPINDSADVANRFVAFERTH